MRAVNVGIGHDDDLVIAQLVKIDLILNAAAKGRDHRTDLRIFKDAVHPCLLYVQDLTAQRQDRLCAGISSLLRTSAGGITLDDIDLAFFRIAGTAVAQFSRQRRNAVQRALSPCQLTRLFGGQTRLAGDDRLIDDYLGDIRMFHEETLQLLSQDVGDDLAHL